MFFLIINVNRQQTILSLRVTKSPSHPEIQKSRDTKIQDSGSQLESVAFLEVQVCIFFK